MILHGPERERGKIIEQADRNPRWRIDESIFYIATLSTNGPLLVFREETSATVLGIL